MKKIISFFIFIQFSQTVYSQIIDHHCISLPDIPVSYINIAKETLHIAYEHTSHGSQITTGMSGLYAWQGPLYSWNDGGSDGALDIDDNGITGGTDLGYPDFFSWEVSTRSYLDNPDNSDVNVVMWSWCGEVSTATESEITSYLSLMNGLEEDYPDVTFVYMTGHLDGTGMAGNLHIRNEQIRKFCRDNGKFLYDFADIESFDPDGNDYRSLNPDDGCNYDYDRDGITESSGDPARPYGGDRNWAIDWQDNHIVDMEWYDTPVSHTQPLNGNLKAYAAWWLWARIAGWPGPSINTGTIIGSPFCAGTGNIIVPFTYEPLNAFTFATFTAQLSDPAGSFNFVPAVVLGSVTSHNTGSQSIRVTIPAGTATGAGYRIRVVNEDPSVTFNACVNNLMIFATGTWIGGAEGKERDWNTGANWCGGVPGNTTNVSIPAGPNNPIIEADVTADCNDLEIVSGALITIESEATTSGSLIVHGNVSGNAVYNRLVPADGGYHYISSPVGSSVMPSAGTFWAWDEVSGSWGEPVTVCESGVGYALKAEGGTISFTGPILNSPAPITATSPYEDCDFTGSTEIEYAERDFAAGRDNEDLYGGGGWNLLGNPFPSALNALLFINHDANINSFDPNYKALYIYDGTKYSYIGEELEGWENADGSFGSNYLQTGQGFFVLSHCNRSTFTFTPDMQAHSNTVVLTKSSPAVNHWPGLNLKVKYGSNESLTTIVYNEQMTAGLDPGYDIGQLSTGPDVEIYTAMVLKDNSVNFERQALPLTYRNAVPVGIDTEKGGVVTFSASIIPSGNFRFWLEDREENTFTDLNSSSYTVNLSQQTYGTGRFYIYASSNSPSGKEDHPLEEAPDLRIWTSEGRVIIKGSISDGSTCEMYDSGGRQILKSHLTDEGLNVITLPVGLKGVYIVRVVDGIKVTTAKVALL